MAPHGAKLRYTALHDAAAVKVSTSNEIGALKAHPCTPLFCLTPYDARGSGRASPRLSNGK
eukprot:gene11324-biopygen4989